MKEQVTKINWTLVNPYEESTIPSGVKKHVLIAYKYNPLHEEYVIKFNPNFFIVKELPFERREPKVYLKLSHDEDVEITKWAILEV